MSTASSGTTGQLEFSFPLWRRVASPVAVGIGFGGVLWWALRSRSVGLVAWLAIAVVIASVAAEVLTRSVAVVVTTSEIVERDLLRQRVLPLARLERARLFRNKRLWLYFSGEPKPVWILSGMGEPRPIMGLVVSRAQALGVEPEVVFTDKA